MKDAIKRIFTIVMTIVILFAVANPMTAEAAAKVKLNKTKATLTITDSKKNPTVTLKVTGTSRKATWSTSDKTVATVKNGKVTAQKAGNVTITCKVNGKKYTCKVTVVDKRAALTKKTITLTMTNKKASPSATLKVKNAQKSILWTTSDKKVAAIEKAGKNSIRIVARKAGKAVITCKVDGRKLTCKVTVSDKRTKKTTNTGNSENTGGSGNAGSGNSENKPVGAYVCGTCLCGNCVENTRPGGPGCGPYNRCGYTVDIYPDTAANAAANKAADEAMDKHMYEHMLNGDICQFATIRY